MTLNSKLGRALRAVLPNQRAYTIVRFETRAALQRLRSSTSPELRKRIAALATARGLSVNVGSGGRGLPGWLNIDAVIGPDDSLPVDIRKGLPLSDGSVRRILAEHVIEHLHFRDEAPDVLAELHRVLEPGGVARIIVPDLEAYVCAYASRSPQQWSALGWDLDRMPHDIYTPMHILNHIFQQDGEHLFGYDFETLAWLIRRAGFTEIVRQSFRQSLDPELAIDREEHARYSLYVDARKSIAAA